MALYGREESSRYWDDATYLVYNAKEQAIAPWFIIWQTTGKRFRKLKQAILVAGVKLVRTAIRRLLRNRGGISRRKLDSRQ